MTSLEKKISATLSNTSQRSALLHAVQRGLGSRKRALESLPGGDSFREDVREVKERCISKIDELAHKFTENARKRGARVFFAKNADEACRYVMKLAQAKNAKLITKSKSLTTEEIELNHPLEAAGLQVIETDLGERIIQMAQELPYHLVFPAVHKTAAQVAELFSEATGESVSEDLNDIMALMRRTLRPLFLNADIGITGANVAIAETGTVLIETNEGNGRLVSSIPPVHVCVMGMEKIVETLDDAMQMIFAHPVSAVGQILTTYVSFFTGRAPLGDQRDRELHIVILDNGRSEMRQDSWYREALHCIRCGACMNICPTYGVLGGHVFGHIYPGPIGIPWTANVHGLKEAAEFSDLCISCGLCKEICPADIDIPMMIAKVKSESLQLRKQPWVNRILMGSETVAGFACATAPLSNWVLQSRLGRFFSEKLTGIERRRTLPEFATKRLKTRIKQRRSLMSVEPVRKVAFFADYFGNYVDTDLALAAIEFLEKAQVAVEFPKQKSSGYPYLSYGELGRAKKSAEYNVSHFSPLVEAGYAVVTLEPTAGYCFKHVYPKLLDYSEEAGRVADESYDFFEFIEKMMQEGVLLLPPQITERRKFGFHIACHQRSGNSGAHTLNILRRIGLDVEVVETGTCCGMGGTFGLKTGPLGYELSTAVGEQLCDKFRASEVDAIITESSVCKIQLAEGTGLQVYHPLELIPKLIR